MKYGLNHYSDDHGIENNNLVELKRNHNQNRGNYLHVLNQCYFGLCMVDTNIEYEVQAFVYSHQIRFCCSLKPFVNPLLIVVIRDLRIFVPLLQQQKILSSDYNALHKVWFQCLSFRIYLTLLSSNSAQYGNAKPLALMRCHYQNVRLVKII